MMRRLFVLFAALVLAIATVGALWRLNVAPAQEVRGYTPQGPGDVYLALGDSLATGFSLTDPANESYVALLGRRLAERGVEQQINVGVAGATSASLLSGQLPRALRVIEEARAAGLRVSPITIDIGGNDLRAAQEASEEQRRATVQQIGQNIGTALDALREASPDADIAVMTYYDPVGGDPGLVGSEAFWVKQLNDEITLQATRRDVAVADVYTAFSGGRAYEYTNILVGDIHANARGHALIAEQYWRALGY